MRGWTAWLAVTSALAGSGCHDIDALTFGVRDGTVDVSGGWRGDSSVPTGMSDASDAPDSTMGGWQSDASAMPMPDPPVNHDGGAMDGGPPSWKNGDVIPCISDDDCIASESCVFARDHGTDEDHQICYPRADLASDGESCMQRNEPQAGMDVDLCAYPLICAGEVTGHGVEGGNVSLDEANRHCRPTCTDLDKTRCGDGVCLLTNRNLEPWVGACFPSDDCDFSGGCPVGKQCRLVVDMNLSRTVPRCLVPNSNNAAQGASCWQMEDCAGSSSCWGTPGTKPVTWFSPLSFHCHALCDLGDPSPPCTCVAPDDGTLSMRTLAVDIGLCL